MSVPPLVLASRALARQTDALAFSPPVHHVYNPLRYAREPWERYLARYSAGEKTAVFLGMNPGPWGMAQTGVPFGEVSVVREWLAVAGRVTAPSRTHPRLPVRGFSTTRSEVSGRRLWGLLRQHYDTTDALIAEAFVANYCPLLFLDEAGRNLTPDKIAREDRGALYEACDRFLLRLLQALRPRWAVGIGTFAAARLQEVVGSAGSASPAPRVVMIPHPSPANPQANRDWAGTARAVLVREGIWNG